METRATAKYVRVSAQKARLVVDLIRGKMIPEALSILEFSTKAVSRPIKKVLNSAVANAENNSNLDVDRLYVKTAFVDQGPVMKRMHANTMGRGFIVKKKMSHITLILDERAGAKAKAKKDAVKAKSGAEGVEAKTAKASGEKKAAPKKAKAAKGGK